MRRLREIDEQLAMLWLRRRSELSLIDPNIVAMRAALAEADEVVEHTVLSAVTASSDETEDTAHSVDSADGQVVSIVPTCPETVVHAADHTEHSAGSRIRNIGSGAASDGTPIRLYQAAGAVTCFRCGRTLPAGEIFSRPTSGVGFIGPVGGELC
jgi:hypothetical protein